MSDPATSQPKLFVGLDVGTTFTGVAAARGDERAESVSLGSQRVVMPTAVWFGEADEVQVGEPAARHLATDPDRVARLFKRAVGSDRPLPVAGRSVPVETLLGQVISTALTAVRRQYGTEPSRVALTFPASWGPYRQGILVDGARQSGLDDPLLVTEPEAAASFYATQRDVADGSLLAVFDFGGGTLDIAVVHKVAGGFELLGHPEGDDTLGGATLDGLLLEFVGTRLRALGVEPANLDPQAQSALERECIEAKEALSFEQYADIPVTLPTGHHVIRVTRDEFEALIGPAVDQSHHVLTKALAAADVTPSELTAVLLVGGTSRIPLVAATLGQRLACEIAVNADPKTSVALGAARLAAEAHRDVPTPTGQAIDLGIDGLTDPVLIGSGGYSVVYRARQTAFDRDVAVKVVTGGGFDLTARRQFERECRTIGRLSEHPNIVTVFDSGVPDGGAPYLVMAYLARGSLQDRLTHGGAYDWPTAVDITLKIGDALAQAHEAGIVHCDVKPANILVSSRGEPQLADFGLARVAERTGTQSIMGLVGTPHYSPPELFDGATPAPTRDIYSLAATAHALMTGRPPIGSGTGNVLTLMRQVVSDPPEDLRTHGVPPELAAVIESAMDKDPDRRPAGMEEFLSRMQIASGRAMSAAPIVHPRVLTPVESQPARPVAPQTEPTGAGPGAPPAQAVPIEGTQQLHSALPFEQASGEIAPMASGDLAPQPSAEFPPMASGEIVAEGPAGALTGGAPLGPGPGLGPEPVAADRALREQVTPEHVMPEPVVPEPVMPAPAWPEPVTPGPSSPEPPSSSGRRRSLLLAGGAGIVLSALFGAVVYVATRDDESTATPSSETDPTVPPGVSTDPPTTADSSTEPDENAERREPVTGFEQATIHEVSEGPWTPAVSEGILWVPHQGGVSQIDLDSGVVTVVATSGWPETPLVTEDSVWLGNIQEPILTRIDLADPSVVAATIDVGNQGFTPVATSAAVWVSNRADNTISRIDPATNTATVVDLGSEGVTLAAVSDEVWVSTSDGLFSLSADGSPTPVPDVVPLGAAVEAFGSAWVVDATSRNIVRLDPATRMSSLIDVGGAVSMVVPSETMLWFVADSQVFTLNPVTGAVVGGPALDADTILLAPTDEGAWVATRGDAPQLLFIAGETMETVASADLVGVPDTPLVLDDRVFVSLSRDGTQVVEFTTLRG